MYHCIDLYSSVQYCNIDLYCTVLYLNIDLTCTVIHYTVLYCTLLYLNIGALLLGHGPALLLGDRPRDLPGDLPRHLRALVPHDILAHLLLLLLVVGLQHPPALLDRDGHTLLLGHLLGDVGALGPGLVGADLLHGVLLDLPGHGPAGLPGDLGALLAWNLAALLPGHLAALSGVLLLARGLSRAAATSGLTGSAAAGWLSVAAATGWLTGAAAAGRLSGSAATSRGSGQAGGSNRRCKGSSVGVNLPLLAPEVGDGGAVGVEGGQVLGLAFCLVDGLALVLCGLGALVLVNGFTFVFLNIKYVVTSSVLSFSIVLLISL